MPAPSARQLWTESTGNPDHPTLLLIMGANACSRYWPEAFVQHLVTGGLRVLRYDHRDTGRSPRYDFATNPYTALDLARDAASVLDAHGVSAAHVLGMSLGGTLGQLLALDHRSRLLTLTVTMTAALDVDFVGNLGRALRGEPSPDGLPTPDPALVRSFATRAQPATTQEEEILKRLAEWRLLAGSELPFDEPFFRHLEELSIAHAGTWQRPFNHALATPVPTARGAELRAVTTPTLVIQAPQDPLNPPPHGRHLADLIPGARYAEIPGLGHALSPAALAPLAELVLSMARGDHGHPSLAKATATRTALSGQALGDTMAELRRERHR